MRCTWLARSNAQSAPTKHRAALANKPTGLVQDWLQGSRYMGCKIAYPGHAAALGSQAGCPTICFCSTLLEGPLPVSFWRASGCSVCCWVIVHKSQYVTRQCLLRLGSWRCCIGMHLKPLLFGRSPSTPSLAKSARSRGWRESRRAPQMALGAAGDDQESRPRILLAKVVDAWLATVTPRDLELRASGGPGKHRFHSLAGYTLLHTFCILHMLC